MQGAYRRGFSGAPTSKVGVGEVKKRVDIVGGAYFPQRTQGLRGESRFYSSDR